MELLEIQNTDDGYLCILETGNKALFKDSVTSGINFQFRLFKIKVARTLTHTP
jgi:hypothetical protein